MTSCACAPASPALLGSQRGMHVVELSRGGLEKGDQIVVRIENSEVTIAPLLESEGSVVADDAEWAKGIAETQRRPQPVFCN